MNNSILSKLKHYPDFVPILDEGVIYFSDEDGKSHPFPVTPEFLDKVCANMNRRADVSGDLSPLVKGKHTDKDANPQDQPPLVGYAHTWKVIDFKGKKAVAARMSFHPEDYEECIKRFPRRSAEVWLNRAEIDPISLLGATTPERDLGLVHLSRNPDLKISYLSREIEMPETQSEPEAKAGETGLSKKLDELIAMFTQFMSSQAQPGAGGPAGAAQPQEQMSDDELEQLLKQLEGGEPAPEGPKKEEPVSQNSSAPPGGDNTMSPDVAKLSRQVVDLQDALMRREFEGQLTALKNQGYDLDVAAELTDMMASPPDFRPRMIERISKNYRKAPINDALHPAIASADAAGKKTIRTAEERDKVSKNARQNGVSFERQAETEGYTIPGRN